MNKQSSKSVEYRFKKEVDELLSTSGWSKDERLTQELRITTVYRHIDGRIINVFELGYGHLYLDSASFDKTIATFRQAMLKPSRHILAGRLCQNQDFPKQISELIEKLAVSMKLNPGELDFSYDSVKTLQAKVQRRGKEKCLEEPIFSTLVAYLGEIQRQMINGRWEMILSPQDQETWEPWVIDPEGRSCNAWDWLYDMLSEPEPINLTGIITVEVNTRYVRNISNERSPSSFGISKQVDHRGEDAK
jgi:hypothetical protein